MATLGGTTLKRNDPINVTPPKVPEASEEGNIAGIVALAKLRQCKYC